MTRRKIGKCPTCCPNGGAIFVDQYFCDSDDSSEWGHFPTCQNCGHRKAAYKPRKTITYDELTQGVLSPEQVEKLGRFDLVRYHYFNPAGILAKWQRFGAKIDAAAAEGVVKSGFWLAYGPTGFHRDELGKLIHMKQFKVWKLHYTLGRIADAMRDGEKRLDEALAGRVLPGHEERFD